MTRRARFFTARLLMAGTLLLAATLIGSGLKSNDSLKIAAGAAALLGSFFAAYLDHIAYRCQHCRRMLSDPVWDKFCSKCGKPLDPHD